MKTETNPFGNSIGVIGDQFFTGKKWELNSKLAFHVADTGITGGIHFFEPNKETWDVNEEVDSIIYLGWEELPVDLIQRLSKTKTTPVVQINLNPQGCDIWRTYLKLLNLPGTFYDMTRLDLVTTTQAEIETYGLGHIRKNLGNPGDHRFIWNVDYNASSWLIEHICCPKISKHIANMVSKLLDIPIAFMWDLHEEGNKICEAYGD